MAGVNALATIVIDAGHGGFDNGAMYQGRKEKNDNLDLALAVGNLLKQKGYDVIFTRDSDVYQSPYEKAQIANEAGADYFLSFHRNAAEQDNTYNGVQTLIYSWDDPRAGQLAGVINEELEKLGFQNLGIEERTGLVVLRQTEMPAVLIETGFIDHDKDNRIFDSRFDEIAEAIAGAVEQTVPLTQNAASQEHRDGNSYSGMQMDSNAVYGVEAGRFGYHTTANFLAEQLEDQGFSSYVFEEDGIVHVVAGKEDSLEDALEIQKKLRDLGYQTLIIAAKRE
ncbi:N-acetylmuramoyl-L-alanine amidase [Lachnospiraceae bacterium]|nr:N-acetylmuramoyl-L-alanine amidase [Lachnospiraceae bacterium]